MWPDLGTAAAAKAILQGIRDGLQPGNDTQNQRRLIAANLALLIEAGNLSDVLAVLDAIDVK